MDFSSLFQVIRFTPRIFSTIFFFKLIVQEQKKIFFVYRQFHLISKTLTGTLALIVHCTTNGITYN